MSNFFTHQDYLVGKLFSVFEGVDAANYGYVYKTTNLINGKTYIGQHKGEFTPLYIGSGTVLRSAVAKYGRNNFKVELLATAVDKDSLNKLEKFHISKARELLAKGTHYNIADGGYGGYLGEHPDPEHCMCVSCRAKRGDYPRLGTHWSEDMKQRMRAPRSEEAKKNMRAHQPDRSGEKGSMYGRRGSSHPMWGTRWMHNKETSEVKKIRNSDTQQYLNLGWDFGRNFSGKNNPNYKGENT